MSITQFLKTGSGIAALAGSGGLAAGLGLAGSLFGQSGSDRLKASRDASQQAARERFDPSIYQPMQQQGQTMATQGLGRMEDIARERTVASLFRQSPQAMGGSARDLAMQQQQSGMARQAMAGFEGQLTQADIARRQEGEMMATQAETQMRDTRAQRGSALQNIESMYQAERGRRRDATIGSIFGAAGQLGAAYLMGRGTGGEDAGVIPDAPELPTVAGTVDPSIGDALGMQQGLETTEADIAGMFDGVGDLFGDRLDPLTDLQVAEQGIAGAFGEQTPDFGQRLETEQPTIQDPTQERDWIGDLGIIGTLPAMFSDREIQTDLGRGITNVLGRGAQPFVRGAEQFYGTLGRATEGLDFMGERDPITREQQPTQLQGARAGQVLQGMDLPENAQRAFGGVQGMFGQETQGEVAGPVDPVGEEYQGMLSTLEAEHGLPTGLLNQVMMTESAGRLDAVSPRGATGLFQFMGPTADELGIDPTDPVQSAQGAAQYLSKLIDQFGSVELGLAAYNAGQGRVRQYGGIPPFPETQNYVANIMDALNR